MADTLLYPYAVLEAEPRLTVTNPRLDGQPDGALIPRENLVDLNSIDGPWRRVRLRASVQLPSEKAVPLVDDGYLEVVAAVHCSATNLRHAVRLEPDPGRPGSFTGEIELERELLADRARIGAVVAGVVDGVAGRWLAHTNAVDVQIAELRIPEITGDLDIAWRHFDQEHEGWPPLDATLHDQLSYLELEPANGKGPCLWLNDSVVGLRRLLDERPGRTRPQEAMRQAVFDGVATSAMQSMFNVALQAARELRDDDGDPWPAGWKGHLLRALLPLMYPDREMDDALDWIMSNDDADGAADLHQRVHTAVARQLKTNANAKRAVKVLEEDDQ